jgi:hypothetical protein
MSERGQFSRLRAGSRAGMFADRRSQAAFATIQLRKSSLTPSHSSNSPSSNALVPVVEGSM